MYAIWLYKVCVCVCPYLVFIFVCIVYACICRCVVWVGEHEHAKHNGSRTNHLNEPDIMIPRHGPETMWSLGFQQSLSQGLLRNSGHCLTKAATTGVQKGSTIVGGGIPGWSFKTNRQNKRFQRWQPRFPEANHHCSLAVAPFWTNWPTKNPRNGSILGGG